MHAARLTPLIGAWPKLLVPFVIIVPGLIASQLIRGSAAAATSSRSTGSP